MDFDFLVGGKEERLSVQEKDGVLYASFGDSEIRAEVVPVEPNVLWMDTSEGSFVVYTAEEEGKYHVFVNGCQLYIERPSNNARPGGGSGGALKAEEVVEAPMPGVIVDVPVREGEVVQAGQVLVVVESMKMENGIRAVGEGRVKRIHVKAGDSVNFGAPLVELEPVGE